MTRTKTKRTSLLDLFKQYRLERELSPAYCQQIEIVLGHARLWNGGPVYVDDLSDDFLNRFLAHEQARGIRGVTLQNRRRMMLTMWRAAWDRELIGTLPKRVRKISAPTIIPEAWTQAEVLRILEATDDIAAWSIHLTAKVPTRLFWRALILTAWDTGLRKVDLDRLTRESIGADGAIYLVQHKTGWPIRCTVAQETLAAIDATEPSNRKFIFGHSSAGRGRTFKRIVKAAGLKGSFKKLRKSSATAVERLQPGAAMSFLGHRTHGLAAKHYIDPRLVQASKIQPPSLTAGGAL